MTYRGVIKDGVVILEENAHLPEGTAVEVSEASEGPTLAERYRDVIGIAKGLPADMAENHDYYIHGTPKKAQRP